METTDVFQRFDPSDVDSPHCELRHKACDGGARDVQFLALLPNQLEVVALLLPEPHCFFAENEDFLRFVSVALAAGRILLLDPTTRSTAFGSKKSRRWPSPPRGWSFC